jgi:phosphatidate cytidylyltransferase
MAVPESRSSRRQALEEPVSPEDSTPARRAQSRARAEARAPKRPSRAGRNLPAAIAVGLGLGAAVVASLVLKKELMLVLIVAAIAVGVWELRTALSRVSIHVPLVPVLVGSVSMLLSAYVGGGEALVVTLGLTSVGVLLWRIADGVAGAARDIAGGILVAVYPGFLAGFAALLLAADDGARRIFVFLLVTVLSDIGGYAFGVVLGKHPMAPSVSPKKSWEGFAGSVLTCVVGGAVALPIVFDRPWWGGALLGACAAIGATVGDLSESIVKRDLGVKDMSNVLPGHGGIMDRLDSLVLVAPVSWALLAVLVPVS